MTRARHWDHAVHDPILTNLVTHWKLDDYEIAERMQFSTQTVKHYREQLKLKRNRKTAGQTFYTEHNRPPPKEKPNPIALAVACLGVTERNGTYWMGSTPVSTTQMMQAYNRQRISMGLEQLDFNPAWRVKA